ncbi:MAG: hypothetical protein WCE50_06150 [Candidatus Acidiferrum sp.]
MASRAYSGYHADGGKSLMHESQPASNCLASALCSLASLMAAGQSGRRDFRVSGSRRILLGMAAASLAFTTLFLTGCGDETPQNTTAETPAKPTEPAVPEDMQAAAQNLLGKETQVLVFGDLAKTGKQQFLAANVVPKNPKNPMPGTIVTRAVLAEKTDDQWSELLRCDEYLKNSKGYLAMTPLESVAGWRVQYDQDPVKGIQLYFTPIKGAGASDPHLLPIGIAWNPATKRYQSLDRTYEHFLMETPSLSTARSVLR